ncbi:MAG: response regulator transcription factor [Phycisphaerae bacterium]|nr:response regulator transcription factor [Phycisphaerae bacterium]
MNTQYEGGPAASKTKILIVDDHPIVRQGLAALINQQGDLAVCGHAANGREAMTQIKALRPDLLTMDITLPDSGGLELMKNIKALYPELPILVISMHEEGLYAERVLRAGARGYIMKQEATEKVVDAIHKVLSGQIYISDTMAEQMVRSLVAGGRKGPGTSVSNLSDRELEVFRLIGQGYSTRKIAEMLHLSIKTVETYRAHIKSKLNLEDAAQLLQYAVQWVNTEP